MAFDPATGDMVLFGGDDGSYLADTWTWNGTNWTKLSPATSPPARSGALDGLRPGHRGTWFSSAADDGSYLADTWTWNGTTWTKLSPATSPTARAGASMVYDPATGNMVLFGGDGGGYLADTWTWNGTTWTKLSPATSPTARVGASMAYDPTTGDLVLFGGDNGGPLADTWTWNGITWTKLSPATSPTARVGGSMAYDPATGNMILFGGSSTPTSGSSLADTWTWNGTTWTRLSPPTSPPARSTASMAYDPAAGNLVLFGGDNDGYLADTWTLVPAFAPSKPARPSADPGNAKVTVTWTAPTSDSPITGYTVTSTPTGKTCTTASLSCTVTGLKNGRAYTFTVTAHNANGTSTPSTPSFKVKPTGPPAKPAKPTAIAGDENAEVSWATPTTEGLEISAYTVTSTPAGRTCSTSALSCTVTGLENGTSYVFTVTAHNADGTGQASTPSVPVTPSTVPGRPGKPMATAGDATAKVTWTAAVTNGSPIIKYTVTSTARTGKTCNTTGLSCTVTGLKSGTSYAFTVKANNADGTGPASTSSNAVTPLAASTGYDMVGSDGGVFVFPTGQSSGFYGSLPGLSPPVHVNNIVGMVPTVTDQGYFLVGSDGGVFAFGNAPFLGSLPGLQVKPTQPITGIVAANTDKGYFLVGRDGGVFAFGSVPYLGSLPGKGISVDNIIGIAATPSGNGYWLVSATGTVYGFGAAQSLGTAKGTTSPVSAIAGTPTGGGYWITTRNGAVHPFGNAKSFGTLPRLGVNPSLPVIGIVHTADTGGYWLIGADGGIFAFGDAGFVGSLPGVTVHVSDVVGAVPTIG